MTDPMIEAARAVWIKAAFDYGGQSIPGEGEERAARVIADYVADRVAALIEAGDRLNELACHQDDCQIVTHGVWSDPIPCTCGYTEAWKKWKEVRGSDRSHNPNCAVVRNGNLRAWCDCGKGDDV